MIFLGRNGRLEPTYLHKQFKIKYQEYTQVSQRIKSMTDKTKKAFNNAIASARMEGFDFTDEQLESLTDIIEQVDDGKMTWREAIDSLVQKYKRND